VELEEEREASLLKVGLVQLLLVALLTVALVHRQNHLSVLLLTLLLFIFGARLWSRLSVRNLRVRMSINRKRVFPGEGVRLSINAENRKILPVWLRLRVPLPHALRADKEPVEFVREQGLLWYQRLSLTEELLAQRRGIYQLDSPQLATGDLMGLYPRMMPGGGEPLELIVYPRLLPLQPFAPIRRQLFGSPGGRSSVVDPIYLLGTREYQPGRPSRYMHWTASARLNRLQERVFEPSRQAKVLFLLDVAPFAAAGATQHFEQAVEALASLAAACRNQGFAVGLVSNGQVAGNRSPLIAMAGTAGREVLLFETLAGLSMRPRQEMADTLRKMPGLDSGVSCILFALDETGAKALAMAQLRQRHIPLTTIYCRRQGQGERPDPPGSGCFALHRLLREEAG